LPLSSHWVAPATPGKAPALRPRLLALAALAVGLLAAASLAAVGCGSGASSHDPTSGELALERTQLVRLGEQLRSLQGPVRVEVAASRGAWPSIAAGLPRALSPALRAAVARARASAQALPLPPFMSAPARLTGPAAGIAAIYENYDRLAQRGWLLMDSTVAAVAGAPPATVARVPPGAASFARENASLYISAIYDAHFDLSLLGKSVLQAYQRLGGAPAFGGRLTQGEVAALATAYSIPAVRLVPHPAGAAEKG
jgi:hypothetical protein